MKKFISAFLWFLVLVLIVFVFHVFFGNKICGICPVAKPIPPIKKVELSQSKSPKLTEFTINDMDGNTLFKFPSNFIINANNGTIIIPESMNSFKDSVYNYLNQNQDKELLISAKYLKSEGEPIGLDRANFLKGVLTKLGINKKRIVPKAVLSDYSYDDTGSFGNGIALLFQNISEKEIKEIEKSITNKTLYSEFGTTDFKPDGTLISYSYELVSYLKKYPEKNVFITGHTDAIGDSKTNYKLGLKRAENVMNYFLSQGVDSLKVKALSKGETEPVASNSTEEGKSKNRRITIIIK